MGDQVRPHEGAGDWKQQRPAQRQRRSDQERDGGKFRPATSALRKAASSIRGNIQVITANAATRRPGIQPASKPPAPSPGHWRSCARPDPRRAQAGGSGRAFGRPCSPRATPRPAVRQASYTAEPRGSLGGLGDRSLGCIRVKDAPRADPPHRCGRWWRYARTRRRHRRARRHRTRRAGP